MIPAGFSGFHHEEHRPDSCGALIAGARGVEPARPVGSEPEPPDWNPNRFKGIVFDVGMHDGSDTAFYLHQGYAVLAVEADPVLAADGELRFAEAIKAGQLYILNAGIAAHPGTATFWICDDHSVWNSFDVRIASRNGSRHHAITVRTCRFADVLKTFGIPAYLKIDIEGADSLCVEDLDRQHLPRFISVECECVGDGERLTADESVQMLDRLRDAGYSRFKLVSQEDFSTVTHPDRWRFTRRVIESASDGRLSVPGFRRLARAVSVRRRLQRRNRGYRFACGSTGPWGDGLLGRWSTYDEARATYVAVRDRFFSAPGARTYAFWYDWHATF